jgi:hypothetical protein
MKLFYHFLFLVCASLILAACASMFASDPKSQAQTDEFTSPESDDAKSATDDTVVAVVPSNPLIVTGVKTSLSVDLGTGFQFEQSSAFKTFGYLYHFQTAMNHLASPQKFK